MAVAAVWPSHEAPGAAPAGFDNVVVRTADGVDLAAWYAPSRNGAAIVVIHGAGGSRGSMVGPAEMLAKAGYGVLALDARGHGESGGRTNRLGWQGTRDVEAAVAYLVGRGVERIGGLGFSMGGEVLLGASATCPEMTAVLADGATRRATAELVALPSERSLWRNFTARVHFAAVGLLTWQRPPAPLLEEMQRAEATSFLLVAAGYEELEVAFNELFAERVGARAELWVVPGVGHTGAFARLPAEYAERALAFFDGALGVGPDESR